MTPESGLYLEGAEDGDGVVDEAVPGYVRRNVGCNVRGWYLMARVRRRARRDRYAHCMQVAQAGASY